MKCDIDIDSHDGNRFRARHQKCFDNFVASYQRSVGNNLQLVMAKLNQGHSHSRAFHAHENDFLCFTMNGTQQVCTCRNQAVLKRAECCWQGSVLSIRLVSKGWVETNPSNICKHLYLTSAKAVSVVPRDKVKVDVCRENTDVKWVGFHPLVS